MRPVFQRPYLRPYRLTPAQRDNLDILLVTGQTPDFAGNLRGQFSRRTQYQGLSTKVTGVESGQQRQRKCRRFTTAGFGLTDEIHACQRLRQGRRLDRGHC